MMKKVFALLMALMMVLSLGAASAAETNAQQILKQNDAYGYYTYSEDSAGNAQAGSIVNTPVSYNSEKKHVEVSKTIAETETENVFDITLKVKTTQNIQQTEKNPAAAAVLVLDVSNSMDDDDIYSMAKGARSFLQSFAQNANGGIRKVAVVSFGENAQLLHSWDDAADVYSAFPVTEDNPSSEQKKAMRTALGAHSGTNTEGGLAVAEALLKQTTYNGVAASSFDYKYVLLMTDGKPSANLPDTTFDIKDTSSLSTTSSWQSWAGERNSNSQTYFNDAASAAENVKKLAELYAIGYRLGETTTEGNWLKNTIATSTSHYFFADTGKLMTQFKNIIDAIGYRANAWQVTDPIGQYLVFETSSIDGDAGASYDAEKNTLNWNLRQATKNSNGEYVMTYTVKLDTLAQGIALDTTQETFTSNQYYKANGVTSLEYYLLDAKGSYIDDDEKLIEDFTNGKFLQTMYFNVPAVKGYKADLTFKKVDDAGNPISDVAFTLALNESGKTWANQPANDVKSDANGVVTFTNIPSGHSYILTEETVPDGYSAASKTVGFDVAYGEIANHNFTDANNELTVVNTRDNGSLTFTKKFAETSDITASNWPADKTIAFAIKDADGNTKNVTLPVKNEDGTYSWTTTVSGLATGKATVTETITAIDGYTAAKVEDVTVNVTTKETVAAEIINTYTRNNGKVSVSKSFADLPEDLRNEITITLTPVAEEGNTATETKTIVLNKGNDWAAKDVVIPTGKYTVTESGADVKDYGFAPEWTVDGKVTKEPIEITVNKDGSIALAVKNTYTKHTGTLTIKKTLNGVTLEQAKGTTFTVNGVDYTLEDFTLENGVYTKQVILPVGEYEVVETNADVAGYDRVTVPTDEKNGKHSQTVTIQKDGNAEAAFTNTYTQKKGKLVVEKTFEVLNAAQLDALDKSKVAFTVTNVRTVSGASVEPVTVTLDKFTQDGSKFTYEMANLLIGTYEVTESATVTVPNFEAVKVTYTPENESQTAATVNVTDEGTATVTASVTNTYTRKDAQSVSFKLTKILKKLGDVAPSFDDFQFELTASIAPVQTNVLRAAPALNDNEISVVGSDNVITVTKAAEGVYTLTISDVPVGETGKSGFVTVYANADEIGRLQMTLKEITTDTDTDWTFDTREYTYSNDKWTYVNEAGETVAEDNPSFTNKYSKNLADLTITKILSGAEAAYPESVQFTVSGVEEPVTLNAANNWTSTIEDLVPGNYTVTEVVVDPDYYDVTTKVDGVESTTKMVPLDYNDVVTVKYENIYTQTPAAAQSVKVIKKIEEGAISAPAQTFKFVGVLTENADGVSTMALVDAKHANVNVGGKTYTNIAFGTPFEFEIATSGKNANGYEETIAIDVNGEDLDNLYLTVAEVVPEDTGYWAYDLETKTIKVAAGAKVEFTNKYNEGYITTQIPVTKTVAQAGNIVPGVNTFYFNAWLVYGDIAPDAEEATMHVKGDMAVDCGNGVFSITVNGANAETAVVEVTYPESVVPKAILLYEMAGSEDKLTKDELAAAGWIYDKSAETYTDETGANHYYWRYFFETGKMSDTDFVAVDEINITNTYTASTPPPKTGDNSNIALWLALMSASALCFVLISKRRSA